MVSGKRAASPVRPMHPGGEANDQETCTHVTKWRYRPTVIFGVSIFDTIQKSSQPRTGTTVLIEYSCVNNGAPLLLHLNVHMANDRLAESHGTD